MTYEADPAMAENEPAIQELRTKLYIMGHHYMADPDSYGPNEVEVGLRELEGVIRGLAMVGQHEHEGVWSTRYQLLAAHVSPLVDREQTIASMEYEFAISDLTGVKMSNCDYPASWFIRATKFIREALPEIPTASLNLRSSAYAFRKFNSDILGMGFPSGKSVEATGRAHALSMMFIFLARFGNGQTVAVEYEPELRSLTDQLSEQAG
jgi:hypothetical protein